ncbi:ZIP family metal transporter [Aquibacillus sp. 3ASR75-11]|uniref:ZIP family metal transporter n=1 Tax=Terrihalobacillus insolitus TaxID=2950438 RepID=A0A9X3WW40_9BACI|nr:ZIP family metal transporter [Terrihalobacillus insolitus]MDC3414808.1 ZIP family metal transporter [Terrihalobacillus insolitus]MDC3425643.1 ZIP family metal transporter [Terrihalobacillus insolitus]
MDMDKMILVSVLALTGLFLGGVLASIMNKVIKQVSKLYVYSGALVFGMVLFEIIPETSAAFDWFGLTISIAIGLVLMHQIHLFTHSLQEKQSKTRAISLSTFFLVIAIAIHNFPSGIAISSNAANNNLTDELIFSFIIHQIPEGLAIFLSLISAGSVVYSMLSFVSFILFLALCFFIALLIGEQGIFQDIRIRAIFMGISIGTLCYVSVIELIMGSFRSLRLKHFVQYFGMGLLTIFFYVHYVQIH